MVRYPIPAVLYETLVLANFTASVYRFLGLARPFRVESGSRGFKGEFLLHLSELPWGARSSRLDYSGVSGEC